MRTVVSSELEDPINTVPSVGQVGPCRRPGEAHIAMAHGSVQMGNPLCICTYRTPPFSLFPFPFFKGTAGLVESLILYKRAIACMAKLYLHCLSSISEPPLSKFQVPRNVKRDQLETKVR